MTIQTQPSDKSLSSMWHYVEKYWQKSGTSAHPKSEVTVAVVSGLAQNIDELGRPLCPCNYYLDKQAEVQSSRRWYCACDLNCLTSKTEKTDRS